MGDSSDDDILELIGEGHQDDSDVELSDTDSETETAHRGELKPAPEPPPLPPLPAAFSATPARNPSNPSPHTLPLETPNPFSPETPSTLRLASGSPGTKSPRTPPSPPQFATDTVESHSQPEPGADSLLDVSGQTIESEPEQALGEALCPSDNPCQLGLPPTADLVSPASSTQSETDVLLQEQRANLLPQTQEEEFVAPALHHEPLLAERVTSPELDAPLQQDFVADPIPDGEENEFQVDDISSALITLEDSIDYAAPQGPLPQFQQQLIALQKTIDSLNAHCLRAYHNERRQRAQQTYFELDTCAAQLTRLWNQVQALESTEHVALQHARKRVGTGYIPADDWALSTTRSTQACAETQTEPLEDSLDYHTPAETAWDSEELRAIGQRRAMLTAHLALLQQEIARIAEHSGWKTVMAARRATADKHALLEKIAGLEERSMASEREASRLKQENSRLVLAGVDNAKHEISRLEAELEDSRHLLFEQRRLNEAYQRNASRQPTSMTPASANEVSFQKVLQLLDENTALANENGRLSQERCTALGQLSEMEKQVARLREKHDTKPTEEVARLKNQNALLVRRCLELGDKVDRLTQRCKWENASKQALREVDQQTPASYTQETEQGEDEGGDSISSSAAWELARSKARALHEERVAHANTHAQLQQLQANDFSGLSATQLSISSPSGKPAVSAEYLRLTDQINRLKKALKQSQATLAQADAEREQLLERLQRQPEQLQKDRKIAELREEIKELKSKNKETIKNSTLNQIAARAEWCTARERLEKELAEIKSQRDEFLHKLRQGPSPAHQDELLQVQQRLACTEAELLEKTNRLLTLNGEISTARAEMQKLQDMSTRLDMENSRLQTEIARLGRELVDRALVSGEEKALLAKENARLAEQAARLMQEVSRLSDHRLAASEDRAQLSVAHMQISQLKEELNQEAEHTRTKEALHRSELEKHEDKWRQLQDDLKVTEHQLEIARETAEKRIHHLLLQHAEHEQEQSRKFSALQEEKHNLQTQLQDCQYLLRQANSEKQHRQDVESQHMSLVNANLQLAIQRAQLMEEKAQLAEQNITLVNENRELVASVQREVAKALRESSANHSSVVDSNLRLTAENSRLAEENKQLQAKLQDLKQELHDGDVRFSTCIERLRENVGFRDLGAGLSSALVQENESLSEAVSRLSRASNRLIQENSRLAEENQLLTAMTRRLRKEDRNKRV
eukprot:TRINITY_DN5937_c0_g1_i1.p1 TRINITY_DN5937_c0_g1~~TRINITY_DN5937_c0_g1_i1.p1  ORF type:complete len:1228 (-),score=223.81 TRINITY_DN5937_c0_g1_i1:4-3645(-)